MDMIDCDLTDIVDTYVINFKRSIIILSLSLSLTHGEIDVIFVESVMILPRLRDSLKNLIKLIEIQKLINIIVEEKEEDINSIIER